MLERPVRAHGLVIAFPQRDVHLDRVSPIEVRLVDRQEEGDCP
jgi:small-conductance mechanosensitive channel